MSDATLKSSTPPAAASARRVLLISVNTCRDPYPVFPLGLAHLDAALHQAGWPAAWLDYQVEAPTLASRLREWQPRFVGISLRNIDDVLIGHRETFFDGLAALCQEIRSLHPCLIILGGSGFSLFPRELLQASGADYGLQGEGEFTLPALLDALVENRAVTHLPGLVYRQDGQIHANPAGNTLDLTRVPRPVRPAAIERWYREHSSILNVQTQRGCAFTCCYCTYPVIEGRHYRRRPPDEVAGELAELHALGANYFFIVDSVFNSSAAHVAAVCEALLRRPLRLKWGCFLRPAGLTEELMCLMARAGLAHVEFGTDSFCDPVLEAYGKNFTFRDVLHASELATRAGVDYCHFLISGGPGETVETLEAGFQNSLALPAGVILPLIGMRIYPHTPLFAQAVRESRLPPTANLLQPQYYLAPGLTEALITTRLSEFSRRSPRWMVADAPPAFLARVEQLRQRGVTGPLWSYYSWLQRFQQAGTSALA